MLKVSENPPQLYPSDVEISDISGRWRVAHTRARFEKAFAWDLLNREIAYFLPMIEKTTVTRGRKRKSIVPLFTSYVFFCGGEQDRHTAMTTNRLCTTIEIPKQDEFIREIAIIRTALEGKAKLDPYKFAIAGKKCRIASGTFKGIEGVVVERRKLALVVLNVSILGGGASMEIDPAMLEPAG